MKNIVNIVNFVRAIEPRPGRNIDMQKPVTEQIRIMKELGLKGTFLLQYDTLIDPEFHEIFETCRDFCELGLWFEIVQAQVEAVGEKWRGRYPWDWYNDVGFLIGYEPEVRLRLIDEAMNKFKEIYGKYPDTVGSWHIDAVSLKYMQDKYHISACCDCRDQIGTDGYTMQGSYYNQAYYPSVNNMFCPAQTKENQITVPLFRLLGSDPMYAYDCQVIPYQLENFNTKCATLEPAGKGQMGGDPVYCEWYYDEIFSGNGLCFQYTQTGQENSFGWPRMKVGIESQFAIVKRLADEGKVEVMTMGEAGKWYLSQYDMTPPATYTALNAWQDKPYKTVWYSSRYYRTNLVWDNGVVRLRDLYVFDEKYKEFYLDKPCTTIACEYRTLPVMDGAVYCNAAKGIYAGIYLNDKNGPIKWDSFAYAEDTDHATVTLKNAQGEAVLTMSEKQISISSTIPDICLVPVYDADRVWGRFNTAENEYNSRNNATINLTFISSVEAKDNDVEFLFDNYTYRVRTEKGTLASDLSVTAENGEIVLLLEQA